MCNVPFSDWVHSDVFKILLKVDVIADHVIEKSGLPKTLLTKCSGFTFGQFFNSTTSGLNVARHSIKADSDARDSLGADLFTQLEGNMT